MTQADSSKEEIIPLGRVSLIWVAGGLTLLAAFGIYESTTGIRIEAIERTLTVYLLQGCIFLAAAFWALSTIGIGVRAFFGEAAGNIRAHVRTAAKYFAVYAGAGIAMVLLLALAGTIMVKTGLITPEALNSYAPDPSRVAKKTYLLGLLNSPLKMLLYLFTIAIIIPVGEELFFRRLLYTWLRRKTSFVRALLVSSAVFGIVHPGGAFGPALIAGLFLGWVYERTNNIHANILIHGAINLSVTAALLLLTR